MNDTILALATPPGRSGIAVIRLSGPDATKAVAALTPRPLRPRYASLRKLRDPVNGEVLDEAVVIHFPAPGSFTGEDVVEVQCHGSRAVVRAVMVRLAERRGVREAEPGEFTRRALENGRLDLTAVEGLSDLLAAETELQRRQAVALATGYLRDVAERWQASLVEALAFIEGSIDFSDDGVDGDVRASSLETVATVLHDMQEMLARSGAAERIREGFTVALCGAPNVGKSTLLNRIAGRDVALTSEVPGTTRDLLEVSLDLDGLPVTLVDTAGLRLTTDAIETAGVERARARIETADLRVVLVEGDVPCDIERHLQDGDIIADAKADLAEGKRQHAVSGTAGTGVQALLDAVAAALSERAAHPGALSHHRQAEAVRAAAGCLTRGLSVGCGEDVAEILALEVRGSLRALDRLVGRVDVEAMLDVVFRNFCVGK